MRHNTTVNLEDGSVEKLNELGLTLTGFVQMAVDILFSEGFDDFTMSLKLKMLDQEYRELENERSKTEAQLRYIERCLLRNQELRAIMEKNFEEAKTIAAQCALVDKLNNIIIHSAYNEKMVEKKGKDVLQEMRELNPDFDLTEHISRIQKLIS